MGFVDIIKAKMQLFGLSMPLKHVIIEKPQVSKQSEILIDIL
jgi:hypothetical protein